MKIEKQVCSRESGAKLQELGVTVGSYFMYEHHERVINGECKVTYECKPSYLIPDYKKATNAWTSGELGEMLPSVSCLGAGLEITRHGKIWEVAYRHAHGQLNENEAEARILMLIWLITEGHVTVEEINQ